MVNDKARKILSIAKNKKITEDGGSHAEKGFLFQHIWALIRIFELEASGANDFLFLFETFEDVAELDSPTEPSRITVYQVKKKDKGQWSWKELTNLEQLKQNDYVPSYSGVESSPIGKLYSTVVALNNIDSDISCSGTFISNAHFRFPKVKVHRTSEDKLKSSCSRFEKPIHCLLAHALTGLHDDKKFARPEWIDIQKVPIDPDSSYVSLKGYVYEFLEKVSPKDVHRTSALVDALLVQVQRLSSISSADDRPELDLEQKGFSRDNFLNNIERVKANDAQQDSAVRWVDILESGRVIKFLDAARIKAALANIFCQKLSCTPDPRYEIFINHYESWFVRKHDSGHDIVEFVGVAMQELYDSYPHIDQNDFIAFILAGTAQCLDQIFAN